MHRRASAVEVSWRPAVPPLKLGRVLPIALLCLLPIHAAYAYVDPNSAGLLYQILFPVLVAIASALTAMRRSLARLWRRLFRRGSADHSEPASAQTDQAS